MTYVFECMSSHFTFLQYDKKKGIVSYRTFLQHVAVKSDVGYNKQISVFLVVCQTCVNVKIHLTKMHLSFCKNATVLQDCKNATCALALRGREKVIIFFFVLNTQT